MAKIDIDAAGYALGWAHGYEEGIRFAFNDEYDRGYEKAVRDQRLAGEVVEQWHGKATGSEFPAH